MKLLYLSCHAILEYDELKLFDELGINWFSLGSYINPTAPVDPIRPFINKMVNTNLLARAPMRDAMPKAFIDEFDTIMIMHGDTPEGNWIEQNWENMKHKRVILRTIGQNTAALEQKMAPFYKQGLEIVRYSPYEQNIEGYIGADEIIRFYKDPDEFNLYNGMNREAITFSQNMLHRGEYCHFEQFRDITKGFPAHVYGPKNENTGELNGGFMRYQDMRQKMRDSRVYIYTGTQPASYTLNFIEAWMTGIPIVALGPKWGNSLNISGNMYEIPDLIQNGVDGFISDDIDFLRGVVDKLLGDIDLAKAIGKAGREKAVALFGRDVIKSKWQKFLQM